MLTIAFKNFDESYSEHGAMVQVLSVLIHEMIHATGIYDHRARFSQYAAKVGLVKPWTSTTPSDPLIQRLLEIGKRLGPIPKGHGDIVPRQKKQTTRMRKYICSCEPKPQIIRAANDRLHATCDDCGKPFVLEELNNVPQGN